MTSTIRSKLIQLFSGDRVFSIIAFASFGGAFALRIFRDTLLISAILEPIEVGRSTLTSGPDLLPLYFFANAFVMTWFAGQLDKWLGTHQANNVGKTLFALSCGLFILVLLFLPLVDGNALVMLAFYVISEIPIFLFMNMLWIVAAPNYTEEQQKSVFPKVTFWAYMGIVFVSGVMLAWKYAPFLVGGSETFKIPIYLLIGFALLFAFVAFLSMFMLPQPSDELPPDIDEKYSQSGDVGNGGLWATAQWAWARPYLRLFIIATVCNFALLGIFDQTMATRAAEAEYSNEEVLQWLLLATFFFAVVAALVQRFLFERAVRALGIAFLNLAAPVFMLLGALVLVFADSDLLAVTPSVTTTAIGAIIAARVFGWFAEFLFNQAMLPYIYGALAKDVEDRGRLFVEGPVTAITNGFVGVGLFLYLLIYQTAGSRACKIQLESGSICPVEEAVQTAKLDLLVIIAIVLAIGMFVASFLMREEYRKAILERLKSGGSAVWLDELMRRSNAVVQMSRVSFLRPQDRQFVTRLRKALASEDVAKIEEIIVGNGEIPDVHSISVIVKTTDEFGKFGLAVPTLIKWLKETKDDDVFVALAHDIGRLGFDGDLLVSQEVNKRKSGQEKLQFTASNLIELAMVLRSDTLLADGCALAWKNGGELEKLDWGEIEALPLSDPKLVLDFFFILLANLNGRASPVFSRAEKVLARFRWLRLVVLESVSQDKYEVPDVFRYRRSAISLLLQDVTSAPVSAAEISIFQHAADSWVQKYNLELSAPHNRLRAFAIEVMSRFSDSIDFPQAVLDQLSKNLKIAEEPGLVASLCEVIFARFANERDATVSDENADRWTKQWYDALQAKGSDLAPVDPVHRLKWNEARATQWLTIRLWLSFMMSPQARTEMPEEIKSIARSMIKQSAEGDRILTTLEQHLPRALFQQFSEDLNMLVVQKNNTRTGFGSDPLLADWD